MSETPNGPELDPQTAVQQGRRRPLAGAAGRRNQADALEPSGEVNREKLKLNQQRLNVGADHKSDSMKKGRRGTFP